MRIPRPARRGALVVLMLVFGVAATSTPPDDLVAAVQWPVGLATGLVLWSRGPWKAAAVAFVLLAVFGTYAAAGWPTSEAAAIGIAHASGVALAVAVVTDGGRRRPRLHSEADLVRYYVACAGSGVLVLVVAATWAALAADVPVARFSIGLAMAHLTSQLLLVPFFTSLLPHPAPGSRVEQSCQWVVCLVVVLLVFVPTGRPFTGFVVLVVLAWGARRLGTWAILAQMVVVASIASMLTHAGRGPFAGSNQPMVWELDSRTILLSAFVGSCALVVVPLVHSIGLQLRSIREASEHRDQIESILNSAYEIAIVGTDAFGNITLYNPGAERLIGYTSDEVMGRSPEMFHSPEEISRQSALLGVPDNFLDMSLAMARPENAGRDLVFRRKDGTEQTHLMTLSPVTNARGDVTGYVAVSEDVTRRVEAQAALEHAVDRMREVDEAKDAFVSSVSHELRTPITSIVGYLELLRDGAYGPLSEAQSAALSRIRDNSGRLLTLIDDLLTFSRVGEGQPSISREPLDLAQVVAAGCAVVEPAWTACGQTATLSVPDAPVLVEGDGAMLERLVVNLVGNAAKFTGAGGRIDVGLEVDGTVVELVVADTGFGVPEDDLPHVFSRFYRSRLAQERAIPGSGLGLAIAKAAVVEHGGTIELTSQLGAGTTVRVRLPLVGATAHSH